VSRLTVDVDSFTYPDGAPVLTDVRLSVEEGELVLVVGPTGSGKSTLLRLLNGLVPHFSGGRLAGRVLVDDLDTESHPPRELAERIGFVPQNPADAFVCDTVEEELAYAMENLGVDPVAMRRRVEETLDLLSIAELRDRNLWTLSGGQQQRVAIAAVLTASPRILVLDEPTSSLDPAAAEEVLAAITRLVHDVGLTVVMAEHRLERVIQFADRVVVLDGPSPRAADPAVAMVAAPVAPPVVEVGRAMGWTPLPLSVRDARRVFAPTRERIDALELAQIPAPGTRIWASSGGGVGETVAEARDLSFRYGRRQALAGLDLDLRAGEVTALMGRNGAGKSTLLGLMAGAKEPATGTVRVGGVDPRSLSGRDRIRQVGLVPQDPGLLLYGETVGEECRSVDHDAGLPPGTTAALLAQIRPGLDADTHPGSLSEGQRLVVALGVVLAPDPRLVLLDEPTRGLDYTAKAHLRELLGERAAAGAAIVVATHDVEFAAAVADRVVVLAEGEVIADGPAREVLCQSTVFAPQVARIATPLPVLTVEELVEAVTG
jgi:energy-coupling factor transporter ATP-binding protein EcfA2